MGNRAGSNPVIPTNMDILNFIIIMIVGLFLIVFGLIFIILHLAFQRRFDRHPRLRYFTIKDFPEFECDEVEFKNNQGIILRGGFYYDDRVQPHQKLIVFSHGIGPGHQAYTHLIIEFVKQGFIVFAYDNMGCGHSDGKSIKGIPQAIHDLQSALAYLSKTTYAKIPVSVIGHSWGAYASIRAASMTYPIHTIISIAPFNDVAEMLGKYIPWIRLFKPFVKLVTYLTYGRLGVKTTQAILRESKTKILVIAGEKDDDVPLQGHYAQFIKTNNPLVLVELAKDHRHNPYLSFRAENYVIDTILQGTIAMAKEKDQMKVEDFFNSLNYQYVGEHDQSIIDKIVNFIS
jgi:hypothetical protein